MMIECGNRESELLGPVPSAADIDRRFRRPLLQFFRQRGCTYSMAEDLTQDVFLRFFAYARSNQVKNIASFVFQVAANLLCDLRRSSARQSLRSLEDLHDEDKLFMETIVLVDHLTPERIVEARQDMHTVAAALAKLETRTMEIFSLYRLEELRHREIAERMEVSVSLVEKTVCQTRNFLERHTVAVAKL